MWLKNVTKWNLLKRARMALYYILTMYALSNNNKYEDMAPNCINSVYNCSNCINLVYKCSNCINSVYNCIYFKGFFYIILPTYGFFTGFFRSFYVFYLKNVRS